MTAQRQERKARRRGIALIAALAGVLAGVGVPVLVRANTTERVVANRYTGVAISGYDPVAYFTEKQAVLGRPDVEAWLAGAVWRFCNAANRAYFVERPDIYAPQFGGYDPVDVARGVAVEGNGELWLVVGQRLYLFSRQESREEFSADPARYLAEAQQRWPKLLDSLVQ
ncbi:YHS domain-containing (seleno)protein [Rhodopseudomonas palustris]|uniref:YHS domain-containing protein n=1 Tax=Rhodopseudomonas palustris (strain BisB18) TaxID=316056 RepID=Q20YL2_RHOPB